MFIGRRVAEGSILKRKEGFFFSDRAIFWGEDLTLQVTSSVLIRKFQNDRVKVTFLGEAETSVNLRFAVVGESTSLHLGPVVSFPTVDSRGGGVGGL